MSADNYLLVDKSEDKFRVSMQFASDDEPTYKESDPVFDSLGDALDAAYEREVREVVVEYGIVIDPRCFDESIGDYGIGEVPGTTIYIEHEEEFLMDCGS